MKSAKSRILMVVAVAAVMAVMTMSVSAQSRTVRVNIPFAFYVGDTSLPAGGYMIRMEGELFRISDGNGHTLCVLSNTAPNRDMGSQSRLVFKASGDAWILTHVRWQNNDARELIPHSSSELEIAAR